MKQTKHFKRMALPLSAQVMVSLMLLLIAMLVPQGAWASPATLGGAEPISYSVPTYNTPGVATSGIASWSTKYADATVVTSSSDRVTWETGWYYVAAGSDITLAQGVDCKGDVHLILADGAKLTVKGIGSADTSSPAIKVTGDNSLTIYGQTNNTGELVADAYKNGWSAAIGGGPAEPGNNITINGGTITANGGIMAAAIGGGRQTETNASHDIVINGGVINATGRSSHPAIGAGWQSNVNGITINGGKITATSTTGVTAIGAGSDGSASNIKVNTSCAIFAGETAENATKLTNEGNDLAAAFSGKKYVFIQPSHTHIYDKQIIEKEYAKTATCSAAGQYYYACSLCNECENNDEHTFEGAPYSHKFTNYVGDNNELTCTAFGTMTASCDYACGTTDTKADPARPALGHIWENDECTRCHATPGILYTGTQGTCTWIIYEDGDMVVSPTEGSTGDLGTWESGAYPSWNTAQTRPVVKTVCFTGSITAQQSFERAFCEFRNATSIDLTNLYTEKATNMGMLFYECNNLVSLNLVNLKTDKATNLNQMFRGCSKLTSLDLSKFNTQDVTVMTHMFYNCKSLQSLTLGNFDMQKVTNVRNMLELCPNLKTLTFKSLPYLADGTFNSQFTGDGVTVNYILDDNSVVFEGENHLPTATYCNHYLSKDNILQEPTCTETGLKQELCKICDHVKGDNITIPSLGHSWGEYHLDGDQTCTYDGHKTAECTREGCSEKNKIVATGAALGHAWGEYHLDGDQTCTNDGHKTAECTREGCSEKNKIVATGAALGHAWGEYHLDGDQTCTYDGHKTAECTREGCSEENKIVATGAALGHLFTEYLSNGDATTEADGHKTAECDRGCGATDTVIDEGSRIIETPTGITNVESGHSHKAIKTIEDGRVVIIRNGVRYDITGRKL